MSAPDSSSSKARPSLLSETAKSAADSDSRILSNLEGRVAAQPGLPRRSKTPWLVAVVAALGLSAFGAWQWQRSSGDDNQSSSKTVAAVPAGNGAQKAVAVPEASAAAAAAVASGAAAEALKAAAASAPQPAVIIAETAAEGRSASAPAVALASAAPAASAPDGERLSRALTAGAQASGSASAPAAHAKSAVAARPSSRTVASRNVHESDKKRQAERVASTHQRKDAKAAPKKNDQDVDLLTALVARTKPYDVKQGKASAKSAAPSGAQHAQTASGGAQGLAEQVAECSRRGLIEAQFCRWHVCADHWGKDPACPSSTFQSGASN